jgi:ribosomal protein L16 Arg81 hydroxylase
MYPVTNAFNNLLEPHSLEAFFTENWTKKGLLISGNNPEKFQDLFSWQILNQLLNFHGLTHPYIRFNRDGQTLLEAQTKNWVKTMQEGATLIVDRVHQLVPAVAEFAAAIQSEIGQKVQVNSYCSPPEQQGFDCHYDTHEVFILQIAGEKEWFVFSETNPYPLRETRSKEEIPPQEKPYLQTIIKPGDVLYIPRGHWHYAVACEQPSLHLTLGINCFTGIDFFNWLVSEFKERAEFRENLPLVTGGNFRDLKNGLFELNALLIQALEKENLEEKYVEHLKTLERPIAPYALPFQLGFSLCDRGFETRYTVPQFPKLYLDKLSENSYNLTMGNKKIALKGVSEKFVQSLLYEKEFTLADLADWMPDADWDDEIYPLLSRLVREGIIFVS